MYCCYWVGRVDLRYSNPHQRRKKLIKSYIPIVEKYCSISLEMTVITIVH